MIAHIVTGTLAALLVALLALNATLTIAQFGARRDVVAGVREFAARYLWGLRLPSPRSPRIF